MSVERGVDDRRQDIPSRRAKGFLLATDILDGALR